MSVPEITVEVLAALWATGAPLIDVRNPDEYERFHVPGAVLIPLGELVVRSDEVPAAGTVYVICQSGNRSAKAAEHLRGLGVDAVNVAGGSRAWAEAGHPIVAGPEPG